ncbi:MAG TPA: NAD(P)(+) transhydrogenase (Re/Si-specific) subunit alpha, partial [Afifellaceae bacterium]|nr:NAD(P)(+) transhydrogenase (Re/Si-specific) subunit alpha [Afifellaceae bacterium]
LVTKKMIAAMRDGSVIVDLAVERGGNVEGAKADEIAEVDGVSIIGYVNMAGRIAATASSLLARNIFAFIDPLIDKESGKLQIDREDEIVAATLLTNDGAVVHSGFASQPAKKEAQPAKNGGEA